MDIVSRLKEFMEKKGVNSSTFADKCKIARPTLSQLLNGRNKKVSDEVVSKIHLGYPDMSIMWLLFGEGNMINSTDNNIGDNEELWRDDAKGSDLIDDASGNTLKESQKTIEFKDEGECNEVRRPKDDGAVLRNALHMIKNNMRNVSFGDSSSAVDGRRQVVGALFIFDDNSVQIL
ncbi:MAG: helix-turn-helix domain-containing protein [Muribaculaceae bacterium]